MLLSFPAGFRSSPLRAAMIALALCLLCLLPAVPAVAQTAAAPDATAVSGSDTRAQDASRLMFMNREVIRFRSSLLGATPEERAAHGSQNVAEIIGRRGHGTVGLKSDAVGNIVLIDGRMAFVVAADDVDKLGGETLDSLTRATVKRLEQAIGEARESRDGRALLIDAAIALAETVVLILLLWGFTHLRRRISARLIKAVLGQTERLRLAGMELVRRDRVLTAMRWMLGLFYWALSALTLYTWLSAVLGRFPYTRAWGEQLNSFLMQVVVKILGGIIGTVPNLIIAITMFLVARAAVGLLSPLFDRVESGQAMVGWLDRDTVGPTRKLTTIVIWIFAVVMAYPYLPGAQTEAFKGMSVLLGLMISLGASSVVGQAASGLILMYSRTIRRGEYVKIGDHEGTVVEMGMFTTRILTGRGTSVTLPNSMIVGTATQNYSRIPAGAGFLVDTTVTIGYDTPWRQVEAMLLEAAHRTKDVIIEPPPRVYQLALSDFYPEYCLVCHAVPREPRSRADVMTALLANVQDVFNEYGVQIMSPHYMDDTPEAKLVRPENWRPAPASPDAP